MRADIPVLRAPGQLTGEWLQLEVWANTQPPAQAMRAKGLLRSALLDRAAEQRSEDEARAIVVLPCLRSSCS